MSNSALLPFQPGSMTPAQLAAVSYLARYSGHTHSLYAYQLRRWFEWCETVAWTRWSEPTSSCTSATSAAAGSCPPRRPAVYARLPRIHHDETRTQGLDRLELIPFLQVAQTISVHHGALAYLLGRDHPLGLCSRSPNKRTVKLRLRYAAHPAKRALVMKQDRLQPLTVSRQPDRPLEGGARASAQISLWRLNLLRVGYLVVGGGLAVVKWPLLFDHEPWGLMEGTVQCMLVAMSVLALLGIRYPLRMLPILLFEVAWKLIWLGVVALPLWSDNALEGATREQAGAVLWVVIVIVVVPWRYVLAQYVMAPGEPWRRSR